MNIFILLIYAKYCAYNVQLQCYVVFVDAHINIPVNIFDEENIIGESVYIFIELCK